MFGHRVRTLVGAETENKHDVTEFESESNGRTTLESHTTGTRETDGDHEGRVHGNIGVTTTQQMIEQEMSLRKNYNIKEDNVYMVFKDRDKLLLIDEIKEKYPDLDDHYIVFIEDTVDNLTYVMNNSKYSTVHITSFMK